jgi:hypothetical protein
MIVLSILSSIIILLGLWIVFVPIEIKVDTDCELYEIGQRGTIKMSFHPGQQQLVSIKILGFPIDISAKEAPGTDVRQSKKRRRPAIRKSLESWTYLITGVVKSFRCRRFTCNVDLDDVVLGAQLFPLASLVSKRPFYFNVNFEKKYYLETWVQVYPHRILWTLIRFFLTKK